MKSCSKTKKYSNGGTVNDSKKPKDYTNTTADMKAGGKSVTGDPKTTLGPHLYELPKKFVPVVSNPAPATIDGGANSKPKPRLTNSRQKRYVTGGSSSTLKSKTGNAKKGQATSNSKTCTTSGCAKF